MKKYKVGYTQGVYDMFHIGHLNLLNNARDLCEHLIVGVNSDELVTQYKHSRIHRGRLEGKCALDADREGSRTLWGGRCVSSAHKGRLLDRAAQGGRYACQ